MQRTKTLWGASFITHSSRWFFGRFAAWCIAGRPFRAASAFSGHSFARKDLCVLHGTVCFPWSPRGILYPRFVGVGVTTYRLPFIEHRKLGSFQTLAYFRQLVIIIYLNAEMIDAAFQGAGRDRKVNAWVVQHPFCVIWFDLYRLSAEDCAIKTDRCVELFPLQYGYECVSCFSLLWLTAIK